MLIPEPTIACEGPNKLERITFTIETIKLEIRKLNRYKSQGPGGLHPHKTERGN